MTPLPAPGRPIDWRVNLAAVWLAQFLSLSAFYICIPFLPLYIKERQFVPVADTGLWSGVFIGAAPASMMIAAPIWGVLGDRYGHKMMLLRSTLAAAIILYAMSWADSMGFLLVLRVLQGIFTGIIPSSQSLVAAYTPNQNQGLAMGFMMGGVNAAYAAGSYIGGMVAERYGAATTFQVGGVLQVVATFLALAVVRENFIRPATVTTALPAGGKVRRFFRTVIGFRSGLPALIAIAFVAVLQTYDGPILPLYIDAIFRRSLADGMAGATEASVAGEVFSLTGSINAQACIIALIGSVAVSYVMDRKAPRWIWPVMAVLSALGLLWVGWDQTILGLTVGRTVFMFFISGLASVLVVILSRLTTSDQRGTAMGLTVTARCVGWSVAPLAGAAAARLAGYGSSYWLLGILCLALVPYFIYLTASYPRAFGHGTVAEEDGQMGMEKKGGG
ncbi:MAG: MFS transporter [Planctomycetes bacterium]|nr:MFS transporter [Planctomycetota bacterium]